MEREGVAEALDGGARGRCARPSRSTRRRSRRELGGLVERLELKPRDLYQPLRVAITGTTVSPGIFESLAALGRDEAVSRVEAALERLRAPESRLPRRPIRAKRSPHALPM